MATISTTTALPNNTAPASRAVRIVRTGLWVLLTLLFFVTGLLKVVGFEMMMGNMAAINFDATSTFLIGVLELVLCVLFWIPRTKIIAAGVMLTILAGACGAHLGAGDPLVRTAGTWLFSVLLVVAVALDRGERFRGFLFGARG